jgi:hypothetical protein
MGNFVRMCGVDGWIKRRGLCPASPCSKAGLTCLPCSAQAGIRTDQELLGYRDVQTAMIYTHMLHRGLSGIRSPLDGM